MLEGTGCPFYRARLRYDAAFQLELGWCSDHGLPHSALLDWESEDRAKLVAYLLESSGKCQQCGTAEWEWEEDRYAYEPTVLQCWGCYLKDFAREDASMPGARVSLLPKDTAAALRADPKPAPSRR